MRIVLILTTISCVHKEFANGSAQGGANCQDIIIQGLIKPCQNFIQHRLSNPAISPMVVEYAKQHNDVTKLVQYAEIDIVYINCVQLIGDFKDIQNLSNNPSGAIGANGAVSSSLTAPTSLASSPQASTVPSMGQPDPLPPVSPTNTVA